MEWGLGGWGRKMGAWGLGEVADVSAGREVEKTWTWTRGRVWFGVAGRLHGSSRAGGACEVGVLAGGVTAVGVVGGKREWSGAHFGG